MNQQSQPGNWNEPRLGRRPRAAITERAALMAISVRETHLVHYQAFNYLSLNEGTVDFENRLIGKKDRAFRYSIDCACKSKMAEEVIDSNHSI